MFEAVRIHAPSFSTPLSSMSINVFLSAEPPFGYQAVVICFPILFFLFTLWILGYWKAHEYCIYIFVANSVVGQPESATSLMTKSTVPHEWTVSIKFFRQIHFLFLPSFLLQLHECSASNYVNISSLPQSSHMPFYLLPLKFHCPKNVSGFYK